MGALRAEALAPPVEAIVALKMPDVTPATPPAAPDLKWLPLNVLRINRAYQRSLSRRSVALIRRMVANFDWARLKALSVLELGGGLYEVLDGQHTAIAAASHGGIPKLPCLVSARRETSEAASAFVDLNTQRVNLTPMQIFFAQAAAGEEIATDVTRGIRLAGGRITLSQQAPGTWQEGDTMAIAAFRNLAKQGGVAYVRRVMAVGKAARLAPVSRDFVAACAALMWGPEAGKVSDQRIIDLVRIHGMVKLLNKARVLQDADGVTIGTALARVLVKLS